MTSDARTSQGMRTLLGIGHSHIGAFLQAVQVRRRAAPELQQQASFLRLQTDRFRPFFDPGPGPRRLTRRLAIQLRNIIERRAPDAIFCALMGNEYNAIAMVRHPRPFDFAWSAQGLQAAEDVEEIPYPMIRAQMETIAARNTLLFWQEIEAAAECPVILVPPPPPIESEAHILAHPGNFAEMAATHGLNPPAVRRKMWLLYCDVLREAVAGSPQTTFMDLPDDVMENGFLAPQMRMQDPTHANGVYGEILLSQIEHALVAPLSEV